MTWLVNIKWLFSIGIFLPCNLLTVPIDYTYKIKLSSDRMLNKEEKKV